MRKEGEGIKRMIERKGGLERREKKGDGLCVCCFHGSKGDGSRGIKAHRGLTLKPMEERAVLIMMQMHRSTQHIKEEQAPRGNQREIMVT